MKAWTKEKKTPDEVFKLLQLDQNIDTVLNSPKLTTWARFLLSYNKKSENDVTLLGTLTKFYGNEPLAKILELSRWKSDTRLLASGLQNAQLTGWQGNGLTTDIVYSMLKVGDQSVEKLLANPALHVWTYVSFRRTAHDPESYVYMVIVDGVVRRDGTSQGDPGGDQGQDGDRVYLQATADGAVQVVERGRPGAEGNLQHAQPGHEQVAI